MNPVERPPARIVEDATHPLLPLRSLHHYRLSIHRLKLRLKGRGYHVTRLLDAGVLGRGYWSGGLLHPMEACG